jgi:F-type H+-transporting ATPase subunit epsilon
MAQQFLLEIVTPERLLVREEVTEAQIPGREGEIGARPEHAPLLTELGIGVLSYVSDGRRRELSVGGGLAEILPDRVRVLADQAERADEIDVKRAEEAMRRANERLRGANLGLDVARALNALRRAQTRLKVAGKLRPEAQ